MAKKIIGMFLGFVLVTVLGVGAYAYTIYQQSTQTLAKTYKQIGEETKVIEATEPLTILLMGVDTGNVERTDPWAGNSDSMILVTVNPKNKKVVMMSLERDILTQIQQPDGSVREAKLNAAYADGGAELAISTIQKMMNIHIEDSDSDTIGGYIFGLLGRTPIVGDTVDAYGYTFEVIKMQGYRISRLRVTPLPESEAVTDDEHEQD